MNNKVSVKWGQLHLNSANNTMVLSSLYEFVMLLMNERDLLQMLRAKARAAVMDKKPFFEVTA